MNIYRQLLCALALGAGICTAAVGAPAALADRIARAVEVYEQAWKEPDAKLRAKHLEQAWASQGSYKDPASSARGRAALSAIISAFQERFPNTTLDRTSRIDSYGPSFRFTWRMVSGDGKLDLSGQDVGELDAQGRIRSITGFWHPLALAEVESNEALVRRYLNALFTRFDAAELARVLAPDVLYTQASGLPYGGSYRGLPEMMKMFERSAALSRMVLVAAPTLASQPGTGKVVASFSVRCTAVGSGQVLEMPILETFELRGGRIVGITPFYFDTQRFSEFVGAQQ